MKKMKKSLMLCAAALAIGGLTGCDFTKKKTEEPEQEQPSEEVVVHVESLSIDKEEMDLLVGESKTITATLAPANANNKAVTFKSSKEAVATVTSEGVVKGVSKGTSLITVQSVDNPSLFKTCLVTVENAVIPVENVVIGESNLSLAPGAHQKLSATVLPDNATNKALVWTSSAPAVVSVDQEGNVEALSVGIASIIVQSAANPSLFKTFNISVSEAVVSVTSVSLNKAALALEETDAPEQLVATVNPTDASNKSVTWSSSDPLVATVASDGTVTPHKKGQTTVTVTTVDGGFHAECTVTVTKEDLVSISLNYEEIKFSSDATDDAAQRQLEATLTPSTVTYTDVEWSSSNSSVASVSSTGLVTKGSSTGTAVITAQHVDSRKIAYCTVTVVEPSNLKVTLPIRQGKSYQAYQRNIQPNPLDTMAEFVDRTQVYEVGDDNKINLRPDFILRESGNLIDNTAWPYPYKIEVFEDSTKVGSEAYSVISASQCDLKFTEAAVGHTYRVSVTLGGFDEEDIAELEDPSSIVTEYIIKVVDGYNVTNEYELSYLDSTVAGGAHTQNMGSGADHINVDYQAFKVEHGLDKDYVPASLVFHKDLYVAPEHIPSNYIVSEKDAIEGNWDETERIRTIGSLKDYMYLYQKVSADKLTVSGNYFTLDWSKMPIIKRTKGKTTSELPKPESHSCFMRCYNGSFEIKNVNFIGNAHAASSEEETYLAGGLIGFKTTEANTTFEVNNTLGHGCYITFFNEGAWCTLPNYGTTVVYVNKSKLFDNYNCFFYNWGGKLQCEQSIFTGCGGPIVIQDHWVPDDAYESFVFNPANPGAGYSFAPIGYVPETRFIDCQLENYVIGTEAWFQSFGAVSVTGMIKGIGDVLNAVDGDLTSSPYPTHGTRSMVFDENHNPDLYCMLSAQSKDSLFNFIVLNKSADTEGMTNEQVLGNVLFLHRDGETLNVLDSYNYQAPPTEIPSDPAEQYAAVQQAGMHYMFRAANGAEPQGAPIFETAGGVAFYNPSLSEYHLYDLATLASPDPNVHAATSLVTAANDTCALYYNGMMLVMGLGTYGA